MLYKCASRLQRLVVAVVRPFTDMAEVVLNLLLLRPRRAWAVLRAWGSFIKWHGALSKKRKAVKRVKKVKHIYRGSIVLRYLLGSRDFNNMM